MKTNVNQNLKPHLVDSPWTARLTTYPASLLAGLALLGLALLKPGNMPAAGGPALTELMSHVESVSVVIKWRPALGGRHKTRQAYAKATVVIVDDFGLPVEGAKVTGDFTGNLLRQPVTVSGTTDASGTVILDSSKSVGYASGPLSFTFCVTGVESSPVWDGDGVCDTASFN